MKIVTWVAMLLILPDLCFSQSTNSGIVTIRNPVVGDVNTVRNVYSIVDVGSGRQLYLLPPGTFANVSVPSFGVVIQIKSDETYVDLVSGRQTRIHLQSELFPLGAASFGKSFLISRKDIVGNTSIVLETDGSFTEADQVEVLAEAETDASTMLNDAKASKIAALLAENSTLNLTAYEQLTRNRGTVVELSKGLPLSTRAALRESFEVSLAVPFRNVLPGFGLGSFEEGDNVAGFLAAVGQGSMGLMFGVSLFLYVIAEYSASAGGTPPTPSAVSTLQTNMLTSSLVFGALSATSFAVGVTRMNEHNQVLSTSLGLRP